MTRAIILATSFALMLVACSEGGGANVAPMDSDQSDIGPSLNDIPTSENLTVPGAAWSYSTSGNHATGSTIRFAELSASDAANSELSIREESGVGTEIFVNKNGAFYCYSGDVVTVQFDDGDEETFTCKPSTTGNAPSAFGFNNTAIIPRIASAETMTVTSKVHGPLTFAPKGLDW